MQYNNGAQYFKNDLFETFTKHFNLIDVKKMPLFTEAMTHSSVSKKKNYERMEFLGDTLLNFCISRMLFEKFPDAKEGILSKKKSFLCSREICRIVAKEIGLNCEVIISKRQKIDYDVVLADVLESFLCLVYYEYGINKVHEIVEGLFYKFINSKQIIDPKMYLQELTQKKYKQLPKYSLISKEGSEHKPIFKIAVSCQELYAEGVGESKKKAEKQAAKNLLSLINDKQ